MKLFDLKTILILGLVVVIILMKTCGNHNGEKPEVIKVDGKPYVVVKREVDTIYKEVVKKVVKKGETIYKEIPIYIEQPNNMDTADILKDFYSKVVYKDTLKLTDSLGYVALTDTIFKNNIATRIWDSHINKLTISEKIFLKDLPKNQVFFGGQAGFDRNNIVNFVGPSLILKNKKDDLYSLSFGYGLNKTFSINGGIYWKIKLRK